MSRIIPWALVVTTAVAALCGCSAPPGRTAAPSGGDEVTGFGATLASWGAHHARRAEPASYGPTVAGHPAWAGVSVVDDRVVAYILAVVPEPAAAVRSRVRAELPPDALMVSDQTQRVCEIVAYRSGLVAEALHSVPTKGPPGTVQVVLTSPSSNGPPAQASYDPRRVDAATFGLTVEGRC